MLPVRRLCLVVSGLALVALVASLAFGYAALVAPSAVAATVGLALGLGAVDCAQVVSIHGLDHRGGRRGDVLPGDLPDLGRF
jgi:hypothetical protein